MTLFRFEPTEILTRPERKIIWAEVQIRGPSGGVVRRIVESPEAAGPEGICAEILALCYQYYPSMARPDVLAALRAPKPEDDGLDALRAEAEAAGVRVDGRWGEARLREEIAAAQRGEAAQAVDG